MREILFRGKRKDKPTEWVYGYLIGSLTVSQDSECNCWITEGYYKPHYEVIPETVGQYIGIKDSYGNKIFEGQYVKGNTQRFTKNYLGDNPNGKDFEGIVEYAGTGFRVKFPNQKMIDKFGGTTGLFFSMGDFIKVVDNPELLTPIK